MCFKKIHKQYKTRAKRDSLGTPGTPCEQEARACRGRSPWRGSAPSFDAAEGRAFVERVQFTRNFGVQLLHCKIRLNIEAKIESAVMQNAEGKEKAIRKASASTTASSSTRRLLLSC